MQLKPEASSILDFMRWAAAAAVVVYHARGTLFQYYGALENRSVYHSALYASTSLGHQAVIIFFVLSGFLVGGTAVEAMQEQRFSLRRYAAARVARIYTVLPIALLVGCGLDLLRLNTLTGIPEFFSNSAWNWDNLSLGIIMGNLLNVQRVLVPELGSNTALWSLTNEVWYYALFPLLMIVLNGRATEQRRLLCGVAISAALVFLGVRISAYFSIWLMGVIARLFYARIRLRIWPALVVFALALGITVGVFRYMSVHGDTPANYWLVQFPSDLLLGLSACMLIMVIVGRESWPEDSVWIRMKKLHTGLASFSFTLYLFHWPALAFIATLFYDCGQPARLTPDARGVLILGGVICVLFVYAALFSLLTERHTSLVRQKLELLIFKQGGL